MIVDLKEEIKNRITMADVCERYGIRVNERGFASCPFHADKTPSLKVYPGKRGFCCFSCGEAGDVIHFAQLFFGADFQTAMRKLNEDFNLGVLTCGDPGHIDHNRARLAEQRRREEERAKQEREKINADYWAKFDRWRALCNQRDMYRPKPLDANLHPLFVEAVDLLPSAEYELEIAEGRRRKYGAGAEADPAVHAG